MSVKASSATNVVQLHAAGRPEARIVAAARVVSIDYRSIVENAVAGLARNTPDARREVYAQARATVNRHLQLMRLPEPIVEVEKLALDLTIKKIERQWRSQQAAKTTVPGDQTPAIERKSVPQAAGSLRQALAALGQAFGSLLAALGLRRIFAGIWFLLLPLRVTLRGLFSPIGLAAALPIVAMAIFFTFFVDNNIAYRSLVDGPVGRWASRLDISHFDIPHFDMSRFDISRWDVFASNPEARKRPKTPERLTPERLTQERLAPERAAKTAPEPARIAAAARPAVAEVQPAIAEARTFVEFADGPPDAPTRLRPLRIEFAAAPEAPPTAEASSACGSGLSISERVACAGDARGTNTRAGAQPAWLDSYAGMNGVAVARAPGAGAPAPDPDDASEALQGALQAAPIVTMPDDPPRAAPPAPRAPLARPTNVKVTALIDSGKRAAVKGDLDRAVHDFTEAIRIDPKYPDSYSERGQAMFKLGETERAISDYSAAIQRDPQHGTALRSRGMAYLYRGSSDLALADLSKAIELAENDPNLMAPIELFYARRSRGSIYGSKQQFDREIADCTALLVSYGRDPTLVEALKANYGDIGAANIRATILRQRANAHIRQSQWELAIDDLAQAIPLSSDRGYTALIDRAKLYEGLGRRDQAVADLQQALGVRPGSDEARLALKRLGASSMPVPLRGF